MNDRSLQLVGKCGRVGKNFLLLLLRILGLGLLLLGFIGSLFWLVPVLLGSRKVSNLRPCLCSLGSFVLAWLVAAGEPHSAGLVSGGGLERPRWLAPSVLVLREAVGLQLQVVTETEVRSRTEVRDESKESDLLVTGTLITDDVMRPEHRRTADERSRAPLSSSGLL